MTIKKMSLSLSLLMLLTLTTFALDGRVVVTWTFASNNIDGTPLTDLAGAKIYYGTSSSNYTKVVDVPGGKPGTSKSLMVTNLVVGTMYYLNGTAYNQSGLESDFCMEVKKVAVPKGVPCSPANLKRLPLPEVPK